MYRSLTGDIANARSYAEKEVDERVSAIAEEMFELDEPEILLGMRRLNGKLNSTVFERFWDELSFYLEEITPACDDRRHSSTLHMPIAISVSNLRDIIEGRLSSKFPSEDIAYPIS